jgi:hypothetical protein
MRIFDSAAATSNTSPSPSSGNDDNSSGVSGSGRELEITGYNFYTLSLLHPECAAAA